MKPVIRLGDPTSHGGYVTSATSGTALFGKQAACLGDAVSCPKPGHSNCTIIEGDPGWCINGRPVALEGHQTSCGAVLISTLGQVLRGETPGAAGGGASQAMGLGNLLASTPGQVHGKRFQLLDSETGEPLSDRAYLARVGGQVRRGTTDADGFAMVEAGPGDAVELHLIFESPNGPLKYKES